MKLIFLDIDGVLNTPKTWGSIESEKSKLISRLIAESSAKIVISSSWRSTDVPTTIKNITHGRDYKNTPLSWLDDVIGVTPIPDLTEFTDTPNFIVNGLNWTQTRGGEIKLYLYREYQTVTRYLENYVIIDDYDDEWTEDQIPHLVKTNPKVGLQEEDLEKALTILNGDPPARRYNDIKSGSIYLQLTINYSAGCCKDFNIVLNTPYELIDKVDIDARQFISNINLNDFLNEFMGRLVNFVTSALFGKEPYLTPQSSNLVVFQVKFVCESLATQYFTFFGYYFANTTFSPVVTDVRYPSPTADDGLDWVREEIKNCVNLWVCLTYREYIYLLTGKEDK